MRYFLALLALILTGCGSQPARPKVTPAELEAHKKAMAAIIKLGGQVVNSGSTEFPALEVYLSESKVTDSELKQVAAIRYLHLVSLRKTNISDAGLKELTVLTELSGLDLTATKITDAGLKELASL